MKTETKDLIGHALNWAVVSIEKLPGDLLLLVNGEPVIRRSVLGHTDNLRCEFSANWAQGGPIIEREGIDVNRVTDSLWSAKLWINNSGMAKNPAQRFRHNIYMDGPTPLVAAMRCYVASVLGDTVEIPEELQ